jgi:hypothetical protein
MLKTIVATNIATLVLASGLTAGIMYWRLPPSAILSPAPQYQYHTVAFFTEHAPERAKALQWCDDNPGLFSRQPDCSAAMQAEQTAQAGAFISAAKR